MGINFALGAPLDRGEFENQLIAAFPILESDIRENEGLIHVHYGALYWYTQKILLDNNWPELTKIFQFVEFWANKNHPDMDNAISVSFLEFFDFQGKIESVKSLFGPCLSKLYQDYA